ncbi:MAG TPA: hypothetical protein VLA43_18655 [Longimicrobiales bacterium]|nr:hypothetical protein [Longimicrobiales bacterium]
MNRSRTLASVLALALAGGACAAPENAEPVYIEDFTARSSLLSCEPVPPLTGEAWVPEDLVPVDDGRTLLLSGQIAEVVLLGRDLAPIWRLELDEEGPGGVGSPISVELADDSTVLVADRGRQLVKRLGIGGEDRGTIRTPFFPHLVRRAGADTVVVPAVLAGYPDRLLYLVRDGQVEAQALRLRAYPGMTHGAFANRLAAVRRPDGHLILMHAFYVPEAYRWDRGEVARYRVPVPDAMRPFFSRPRPVEREEDMAHLPVVGISPYLDPVTGDVLYVTRTGDAGPAGTSQKALIRTDSILRYLRSGILPVDVLFAAPLGSDSALVVSNQGVWHRCEAP